MKTALLTHGKKGEGKDKNGDKEEKKCTYCKKIGHWEKDCWKKEADENKGNKTFTSNNSEKEKKKEASLLRSPLLQNHPQTLNFSNYCSQCSHRTIRSYLQMDY